MKTLGWVALLVSSVAFVTGCGCDPGNNSARAPIDFTPSTTTATRAPATCGVVDPTFNARDTFTLDLQSDAGTDVSLTVAASTDENVAIPLLVGLADGASTTASSTDGAMSFSFTSGSDAASIDGSPLDSVVVTLTALPTADGQPLSAELRLTFEDGRVLDQVYSAPLSTVSYPCK
ncbi:MAG TPA: hypothetical protein VGH28_19410 [Polyangiaceae bacterium]|jgi:hypothetical protein